VSGGSGNGHGDSGWEINLGGGRRGVSEGIGDELYGTSPDSHVAFDFSSAGSSTTHSYDGFAGMGDEFDTSGVEGEKGLFDVMSSLSMFSRRDLIASPFNTLQKIHHTAIR